MQGLNIHFLLNHDVRVVFKMCLSFTIVWLYAVSEFALLQPFLVFNFFQFGSKHDNVFEKKQWNFDL